MNNKKPADANPPRAAELRGKAEERLQTEKASMASVMTDADVRALVHELQVHQVELEMQNEELLCAQKAAQEASEKYYDLFDFAPIGYFLWDRIGRILEVNLAGAALLGLEREAAIRKRFGQFVAVEDRPSFADFCKRVLATDAKQICEVKLQDCGQTRYALVESIATQNSQGQGRLCRAAVIDVSARKTAEDEMRSMAEFPSENPNPVFRASGDGAVLYANGAAAKLLETMGWQAAQPLPEEFLQPVRLVLQSGGKHEFDLLCAEKRTYSFVILRSSRDGLVNLYGRDITERKESEEALRRAKDELEERVRARTADLAVRATQLRALAGQLTLSEQRERRRMATLLHDHIQQLLVGAKFRVAILGRTGDDLVKQASREAENLIDESLAASRSLTSELSPPILHEAGLNAGLEWLARWMANKHDLHVELAMEESGPLADDVKILLFESIRELLFNAVKHSHAQSATVHLSRVDGQLQVVVSDQGVGFDPNAIPFVGEDGGGIGLFGIRERLALIGGSLEIDSAPGTGSRFALTVSVGEPADALAPISVVGTHDYNASSALPLSSGAKIRVLVADDHVIMRQGLEQLLGNEPDLEVVGGAVDGRETVELAARLLPDIILMDLSMPGLNGVEATRAIVRDFPDIRIIGLSMFAGEERAKAMRDAGAVDYLTKSGPAEALIAAIRNVCGR